ncbi:CHASE2 domain-containing protein [Microseira sp. BLCC-F43]|uniref:CHASE2 domain-containing protein n=1 Tax=Microseira sp. BLCC-F43 TaxID=3153602 RepID=UPI0035B92B2C
MPSITMSKLVVLELDGDFEQQGFRVTLEIGADGDDSVNRYGLQQQTIKIKGNLPANPELAAILQQHWQEKYRSLGAPARRIKTKKIIHKGSINQRIKECRESAYQLQYNLNSWLKSESFREIDSRLREELHPGEAIRFLIRTDDFHLQKLPWHLWDFFERYRLAEVALSPLESKTGGNYRQKNPRKSCIKLLVILGHKEGIDIDADLCLLKNLPQIEPVVLIEPQAREINNQLWEQSWDIIFFAGHSETEGETGRIYINPNDSITIQELWYGLRKAVERGLKLAIFNSCDGLGLARQLDDLQIPQMIVMRELIPDRVAQEFLKHFLRAFAGGKSLYLAVREARQRLHDELEREFPCASWLPVIFQHPAFIPPTWQQLKGINRRQLPIPLIASVAVTVLIVGMRSLSLFQGLELQAFDWLMRSRPNEPPDPRLLVITVTEKDVQNQNPQERRGASLSDRALAQLLKKLQQYQPQVIGLDIYRDFPVDPKHPELATYLQQNQHLIAVCEVGETDKHPGIRPPAEVPKDRLSFSDFPVDPDGAIRRQFLGMASDPKSFCITDTSFSFQVAQVYLADKGINYKRTPQGDLQVGKVVFKKLKPDTGGYHELDTLGYQVLLNYRSRSVAKTISLTEILSDRIDAELPNLVKGRIVLIGTTAQSFKDYFPTPYSTGNWQDKMPGVMIQAQMTSQIISAVLDGRPLIWWWCAWGEIFWIWGWSLVGGVVAWYMRFRKADMPPARLRERPLGESPLLLGLINGVALGTLYGLCLVFLLNGGWVPLVPSALALIFTSGTLVIFAGFKAK